MSAGDCFFIDSNVLLYFVDPVEAAKRARAKEWLDALWMAGRGRLSWQVLHEFYSNATRKMRLEPEKACAATSLALDGCGATLVLGRTHHDCRATFRRAVPFIGRLSKQSPLSGYPGLEPVQAFTYRVCALTIK